MDEATPEFTQANTLCRIQAHTGTMKTHRSIFVLICMLVLVETSDDTVHIFVNSNVTTFVQNRNKKGSSLSNEVELTSLNKQSAVFCVCV